MKRFALALVLAAFSAPSLADTVGTYLLTGDKSKQTLTVSYKNDQTIRMDVAAGSYMLVNGNKIYMVTNQNGQVHVVDMDTLPKFAIPGMAGKAPATTTATSKGKVVKTGRSETVAGVKGDVWEVTGEDGVKHEVVISTDRRVQGLYKAFGALARKMGDAIGGDTAAQIDLAMRESAKVGTGGLLRADRQMVLQSVVEKAQPASHYQLPAGAKPMEMPKIDPAHMQQMQEMMQRMQQQQRQQ